MDALGPLCVGIDPHPSLLASWGLSDDVKGLEAFSQTVGEALADRVAVMKPQSAFYERFGSRGIAVLESTIRQLRSAGTLVLLDVKRGDIGSTAAAYADAYLDPAAPLCADAITISPYLGFGALRPIVEKAQQNGLGAFVLALTSNPEGAAVQRAVGAGGKTVAQAVIDEISQVNEGAAPLGDVGVVIGATIGPTGHNLTNLNGPILAPGLGAQGGRAEDLRVVFGDALGDVLPSWSREVLSAGPDVAALRAAADRARDVCAAAIAVTA
ncbi:orotidine-5'-phosphate decarboxylase [Dactylosporangium sp. AC04546]|uniref:orotidine-5'-phosphate decarboxylase n=1 Tax=Dactylosporangium sp. AC04546 TaxID=2862460 RepID=UPI001EDD8A18|nr:orotidine-5'-phosphate decarboxylase [Dactylosporangium sp. AC04546]WVK89762.1 orotidine-5'-phosphate decarboxylase [Dactylosporangium sp. AC04546]